MDYQDTAAKLADRYLERHGSSTDTDWDDGEDEGLCRRTYRGVRIGASWCEALGVWTTTVGSNPTGGEADDVEQAQLIAEEYVDAYFATRQVQL